MNLIPKLIKHIFNIADYQSKVLPFVINGKQFPPLFMTQKNETNHERVTIY